MAKEEYWLNPQSGTYDPTLRAAFTNITEEPFDIVWGGEVITTVKPNETVELNHHLVVKCVKELVDKIMIANAKLNEVEFYKNNPNVAANVYRAPSMLGIPAARKVWEDKIARRLEAGEESPQVKLMRAQIKEELLKDLNAQPSQGSPLDNAPKSIAEFADLTKSKEESKEKTVKPDIKIKKINKSIGRPKKTVEAIK